MERPYFTNSLNLLMQNDDVNVTRSVETLLTNHSNSGNIRSGFFPFKKEPYFCGRIYVSFRVNTQTCDWGTFCAGVSRAGSLKQGHALCSERANVSNLILTPLQQTHF